MCLVIMDELQVLLEAAENRIFVAVTEGSSVEEGSDEE